MTDLIMKRDATISECGRYRYRLSRKWGIGPVATFIMLNPSTADAEVDDATIRKCIGFAQRWDMGSLCVGNLFAWRATKPADLKKADNPIGPMNRQYLEQMCESASDTGGLIVCAWGANGGYLKQDQWFKNIMSALTLSALRLTKGGAPEHPLYIPYNAEPFRFGVV